MLVLCSARPELYERHPGWAGGKRNSTTLALSPLSDEDTGQLVSSMVADALLPQDVRAQLLERASGNPLFAEEFVRMLLDRGLLNSDGTAPASGGQIPLPDTIQATIAARLDSLPASRKSLIHVASVIGKVFWSGALASMGGIDRAVAEEMLHELVRKELVRPARASTVRADRVVLLGCTRARRCLRPDPTRRSRRPSSTRRFMDRGDRWGASGRRRRTARVPLRPGARPRPCPWLQRVA